MKHVISKSFDFCYGHRVHTQRLKEELAETTHCRCRHLHGHQGRLEVRLAAPTLDDSSMVTDFHHLNWFKTFIDTYIDHKMLLDIEDALINTFVPSCVSPFLYPELYHVVGNYKEPDRIRAYHFITPSAEAVKKAGESVREMGERAEAGMIEMMEGLVLVPFVPTSERLSEFLYCVSADRLEREVEGVKVLEVEFNETPKTSAIYRAE